jgi:hypothetical protein
LTDPSSLEIKIPVPMLKAPLHIKASGTAAIAIVVTALVIVAAMILAWR